MKKLLILLFVLVAAFLGIWTYKLKSPMAPNINGATSDSRPWWETTPEGQAPTPDDAWVLDPEIPSNYIPVLGSDELYMVIDENGNIIKYRHRYQLEDGTWMWEDVNPDIPENYEPVEGLENVFKVTGEDGSVKYLKYTRNPDDTYFFTEVDKDGNPIVDDTPEGSEIPRNYVHVSGNVYAVYNEYGVLTGYKERYVDENGNYAWRDCDKPDKPTGNGAINTGGNGGSTGTGGNGGGNNLGGGTGGLGNGNLGNGGNGSQGNSGGNGITGGGNTINPGNTGGGNNGGGFSVGGVGGNIYITGGGQGPSDNQGYVETETNTDIVHTEDGWTVVYETTITKTYDRSGNLISTKKDGPTEVNRFPTTPTNEEILGLLN